MKKPTVHEPSADLIAPLEAAFERIQSAGDEDAATAEAERLLDDLETMVGRVMSSTYLHYHHPGLMEEKTFDQAVARAFVAAARRRLTWPAIHHKHENMINTISAGQKAVVDALGSELPDVSGREALAFVVMDRFLDVERDRRKGEVEIGDLGPETLGGWTQEIFARMPEDWMEMGIFPGEQGAVERDGRAKGDAQLKSAIKKILGRYK